MDKSYRPPLTSLLPLTLEFLLLLGFCVFVLDMDDIRAFLPGDNADIFDYGLFGFILLIPLYFIYGVAAKLRSRITVGKDAFILHELLGVTELSFKDITAIRILKAKPESQAHFLVQLFSIFGRERLSLDLGFGCLAFILKKDEDSEYLDGFTPKTANELRVIFESTKKD